MVPAGQSGGDPPETTFAPGFVIGQKYEVVRTLGTGGMGTVVAARDTMVDKIVAVKVMHEEMAKDADHVERFLREGRAAARLESEHTTRVFDVGRMPSGAPFLVMEYLDGEDLEVIGERRQFTVDEVVDYVLQACAAISEAHKAGLVHRDLKPQNLFLTKAPGGRTLVKVLDFGLAKDLERLNTQEQLTTENMILGSPHFMSPEQIRAPNQVDKRTDIWALGATIHHLFTGEPPWSSQTVFGLIARIMAEPPPPVRQKRPDVPEALEAIIARCLERDPAKRFESVDALAGALRASRKRQATQLLSGSPLDGPTRPLAAPTAPFTDDSGTLPIGTLFEQIAEQGSASSAGVGTGTKGRGFDKGRTLTMAEMQRLREQQQQLEQQQQQASVAPRPSFASMPSTSEASFRATAPLHPRHPSPTGPQRPPELDAEAPRPLWPYVLGGVLAALVIVAIALWVITRLRP
ncbi:MAG: serine/threonine protein kinase [Deltaproteobacteria bacterium]|nr:serine/threonine protein kinase [Deltaproteobacteria bacterium]